MYVLAAIPQLGFGPMTLKTLAWAGGDASRLNVA